MPKFDRLLSKEQLAHRQAKRRNKPGGKQQRDGTQSNMHILPDKPAFVPMPTIGSYLEDLRLAEALGIKAKPEAKPAPKEVIEESEVKEILVPAPEPKGIPETSGVNPNPSGNELQPRVDTAGASNGSAVERFKARQRIRMNGGANGAGTTNGK